MGRPENQGGVFCEIVSLNNIRHYTHKFSSTRLPKCESHKNNNNEHTKLYKENTLWP